MTRITTIASLIAASLTGLVVSGEARAELSPGADDMGYRTFEIRNVDDGVKGNQTLGMVVVIGKDTISGPSAADSTDDWQAGTAYWNWGKKKNGSFCSGGSSVPDFNDGDAFVLVPKYDTSSAEDGSSDWAIVDGMVKGCAASDIAYSVQQQPLDEYEHDHEWNDDDFDYWSVSSTNASAAASATSLGYMREKKGDADETEWAALENDGYDCGGASPTMAPSPGDYLLFSQTDRGFKFTGCEKTETAN